MLARELVQERLRRLCLGEGAGALAALRELVVPQAREIATIFYRELMEVPESAPFLSQELVTTRLIGTLAEWLGRLVEVASPAQVASFVQPTAVTASAGVVVHDGHPDYQRTLGRAQEALATATAQGGDRCVIGGPPGWARS
ncbi:MAG TPA: hypothetical protein VGQ83_06340 [Polyangia bacterium]|jgi:GGDEF domain-containing protein